MFFRSTAPGKKDSVHWKHFEHSGVSCHRVQTLYNLWNIQILSKKESYLTAIWNHLLYVLIKYTTSKAFHSHNVTRIIPTSSIHWCCHFKLEWTFPPFTCQHSRQLHIIEHGAANRLIPAVKCWQWSYNIYLKKILGP